MSDKETALEELNELMKDCYRRGGKDVCDALIMALDGLNEVEKGIEMSLTDLVKVVVSLRKKVVGI